MSDAALQKQFVSAIEKQLGFCTVSNLLLNKAEKNLHLKMLSYIKLPMNSLCVALTRNTLEIEAESVIIFCIEHLSLPLETGKAISHMAEVPQIVKIVTTSPLSSYLPLHIVVVALKNE